MIKTILKELIITILLCIAILLILSVLFYNYNPINKIVPNKIEQYATSDDIKEEVSENIVNLESTSVVYKVEGSDLNMYIKQHSYIQGKANPFESSSSKANNVVENNTTSGGNQSSGGSSSNGNGSSLVTNSDGTFWNSTNNK